MCLSLSMPAFSSALIIPSQCHLPCAPKFEPQLQLPSFFFNRDLIDSLLAQLPITFKDTVVSENCLGAAIRAAGLGLKDRGGKVFVFQATLPNAGPGVLRPREDAAALGTEKEKALFLPQDQFYTKLGQEFIDWGVSVDIFVAVPVYGDVATVGALSAMTGGSTFHYPRFNAMKHGDALLQDLRRDVGKLFAFDALMRVRTCSGLKVKDHYGNFYSKNDTDINLAGMDSETCISAEILHDGSIDEKSEAGFQCAVLYTTMFGERRIRVINLSVPTCTNLLNMFKFAEVDAMVLHMAKAALHQISSTMLIKLRQDIAKKASNILLSYRKHCTMTSNPAQLILPESLKLLPVLSSCLVKTIALRPGSNVSLDEKVYAMRLLRGAGTQASIPMIYPRMVPLHELPENVCVTSSSVSFSQDDQHFSLSFSPSQKKLGAVDDLGLVVRPPLVRMSYERLNPQGVYLVGVCPRLFSLFFLFFCPT